MMGFYCSACISIEVHVLQERSESNIVARKLQNVTRLSEESNIGDE